MKKNNYKTMFLPIIMSLLVVTFVFVGCKPEPEPGPSAGGDTPTSDTLSPNTPSQNVNISDFSVSECLEKYRGLMYDDNDTIYAVAVNDSSLMIRTIAYFNCCSEEFWEELSMEGNKIRIEMFEDDKEPCDCYCPVSVEFVLSNLELGQTYKIILSRGVYGYFSFEVVFEKDTDLMFIR